jgi:hypothetical protein
MLRNRDPSVPRTARARATTTDVDVDPSSPAAHDSSGITSRSNSSTAWPGALNGAPSGPANHRSCYPQKNIAENMDDKTRISQCGCCEMKSPKPISAEKRHSEFAEKSKTEKKKKKKKKKKGPMLRRLLAGEDAAAVEDDGGDFDIVFDVFLPGVRVF